MWVIFLETDSLFSDKAVAEVSAPTEIDMADHQEKELFPLSRMITRPGELTVCY